MKKIIAISGKSGCGNSTISKLIAEKFGFEHINLTFRQIAEEYGYTFENLLQEAQSDSRFDYELDNRQKNLALKGNTVLGSRLAIWLLKNDAITVYLDATLDKRVSNILKRETGKKENDIREFTIKRDNSDHKRFTRLYAINNDNFSFANIVIDANKEIGQIVDELTERIMHFM